jgi:hypothetical protein
VQFQQQQQFNFLNNLRGMRLAILTAALGGEIGQHAAVQLYDDALAIATSVERLRGVE